MHRGIKQGRQWWWALWAGGGDRNNMWTLPAAAMDVGSGSNSWVGSSGFGDVAALQGGTGMGSSKGSGGVGMVGGNTMQAVTRQAGQCSRGVRKQAEWHVAWVQTITSLKAGSDEAGKTAWAQTITSLKAGSDKAGEMTQAAQRPGVTKQAR
ncbi:hypothetical protein FA15DRAFT_662057 [Coprinopsis marcescibilis]|uniref:Uncharacterized protein n=1 Tax=Coprinopsis marcescibilis TaxID=230819 RepID=A0A5C3K935_COPMA|nr:hypothetical protein FA15DRAFT_662057 [Coprinopsis marcescibilis]